MCIKQEYTPIMMYYSCCITRLIDNYGLLAIPGIGALSDKEASSLENYFV